MKKDISVFLLCIFILTLFSACVTNPDTSSQSEGSSNNTLKSRCSYDKESETVTISGTGEFSVDSHLNAQLCKIENPKHIVISEGITSVGYFAFSYGKEGNTGKDLNHFDKIETVKLPDTVTEIGESAFENCVNLTEINIPENVTKIGDCAFENCEKLRSISIPDSVTSIGGLTFKDCTSLEELKLPPKITTVSESICDECENLKSVEIPSGVTVISGIAFGGCTKLESISLGDSITDIQYNAFYNCKNLSEINFPDSLKTVGDMAFVDCDKLESVTIPASVKSIGDHAFGFYDHISNEEGYAKYDGFTIKGQKGSAAQTYAEKNGFKFMEAD